MNELAAERVLRAVECIPSGSVASYGDVAAATGTSARFAARVMSTWGGSVAWWRVPNARGEMPAHLRSRALTVWQEEGIALVGTGDRVDMRAARVDQGEFAAAAEAASADLPEHE